MNGGRFLEACMLSVLNQNYPNPFNPSTKISYSVPEESIVKIAVYDILGREVAILASGEKQPGYYEVDWNAAGFASGIYIYRITALKGSKILFSEAKRMMLMK